MIKVKGWFVNNALDESKGEILVASFYEGIIDWILHSKKKHDKKNITSIATIYFDKTIDVPASFYVLEFDPKENVVQAQNPPKTAAVKAKANSQPKKKVPEPKLKVVSSSV